MSDHAHRVAPAEHPVSAHPWVPADAAPCIPPAPFPVVQAALAEHPVAQALLPADVQASALAPASVVRVPVAQAAHPACFRLRVTLQAARRAVRHNVAAATSATRRPKKAR